MRWQRIYEWISYITQGGLFFFMRHPALWIALAFTLGLLTILASYFSLIAFTFLLLFLHRKEKIASALLFIISCFLAKGYLLPYNELEGKGSFSISSYSKGKYGGFLYKGTLHSFTKDTTFTAKLPCRVFSQNWYDPAYEYIIEGTLKNSNSSSCLLIKSKKPWVKNKKVFTIIELRTSMKNAVINFLKQHLKTSTVSSFLSALVTGETQDDVQKYVFARLGLAHLFAISGFHFALFGFAFHFLLRLFLPKKGQAICLLIILTLFFFYLGLSPSVARAWFMSIFSLIALVVEKEKRTLNTFGLALFVVLLINPYYIKDLSFQLSFLATAGILIFYAPFDHLLKSIFPKEPKHIVQKKSLGFQYLYIGSTWLRKALALNFAVHLVLFPMQLSIFSKFPLHSLTYNLFFPFLVSIALFLLLISILTFFLCPFFAKGCFFLTNSYTKTILWFIEYPPFAQKTWYVEHTFLGFTSISLTIIFLGGILWRHHLEQKRHPTDVGLLFI